MQKKICTKCKKEKDISEFYNKKKFKDGLSYRCKKCTRENVKKYNKTKKGKEVKIKSRKKYSSSEKGKKNRHSYQQTEKFKEYRRLHDKIYKKENKDKVRARRILGRAIKSGKIERPKICSVCGKVNCKIQGHHENYGLPLDVIFCCRECHNKLDKKRMEREKLKILDKIKTI